ncbi:MAG: hypothetical protein ACRYG8_39240 [Janthinobacterium lividum]|jgi:hypothetical protein
MKRIIQIWLCLACFGVMVAGCATSAQDRGPWHEYLHEHKLE